MPANAASLNIPGLISQGIDTLEYTAASGISDTVSSLAQYTAAHTYLTTGDPASRYIVVLGARLNADGLLPAVLNSRLNTAAAIARLHPANKVIVSGGPTQPLPYTEAQAMLAGLVLRGVNPANIVLDNDSFSTVEQRAQHHPDPVRRRGGRCRAGDLGVAHRPCARHLPVGVRPVPVRACRGPRVLTRAGDFS